MQNAINAENSKATLIPRHQCGCGANMWAHAGLHQGDDTARPRAHFGMERDVDKPVPCSQVLSSVGGGGQGSGRKPSPSFVSPAWSLASLWLTRDQERGKKGGGRHFLPHPCPAQPSSKSAPKSGSDQLEHVQWVCWAETGRLGARGLARPKDWRAKHLP